MSRKHCTYTHELAPGLLLTVETLETGYYDEGQYFTDDQRLEGATLTPFDGEPIDLLKGCPHNREPFLWLDAEQPEKGRLIDLCLEKGKQVEKAIQEAEAA